MFKILQTDTFREWLAGLRDRKGQWLIARRIERLAAGSFGDHYSVGGGVSELRIHFGPGYRVYFTIRDRKLVVLFCGGDKSSQRRDIARAQELANKLE